MKTYLIEMLECPACHEALEWAIDEQVEGRIETARARCKACETVYPVREGIGIFLTPDQSSDDLWEQVESHLSQHLRAHPEIEHSLMEAPLESLAPADQLFRSMVLDERQQHARAKEAAELAETGVYTREYLDCSQRQIDTAIDLLCEVRGPVVDLASGMGRLVEEMIRCFEREIVATDLSPRVLRGNRRRLESFKLYDQMSLLAFDARRTPFKDGSIETMTTYLGLANIREPRSLLKELGRIVSGTFLALSVFYPPDDEANLGAIRELGLEGLLTRREALQAFREAGWEVELLDTCTSRALPTPKGVVLQGAGIDALPVAETTLEWGLISARKAGAG